ncbi:winged helix-turn-helix domain-containing protein [Chryseosolibacter indicus]|uniref:Winged helix DNA-binding domain-containing protein n=1 Tax=Chryseosolibacter indicus TaxID=2782351 RepID=A0ABS5VWJ8_9BACT|nr:crosslink repair DNA glycosylase YcaQ family protein [Chryseosolibacter indicus]MBT1705797.1 winged helix DNA-binding domain-containing protein [Chryseosolibacter indicus]
MESVVLSKSQARKIILHAAGLSKRAQFGKGIEAVFKLIDHLGFVQLDSNYVIERAHHHTIASRVPDYKPEWLDQLQTEGRIFEFWTYAAGYLPMHDFRFSLPVKESFAARRKSLTQAEINLMRNVLDRIGREGPLMAKDFENDRVTKSTGWWDWRPSKVALERLHLDGRLMVVQRKDFQKIYDLPENVLPPDVDATNVTIEAYSRHLIMRSLKALGIAYQKEIAFRGRYVKHTVKTELQKLVEAGEVCSVDIKNFKSSPLYMLPEYVNKKIALSEEVFILSPFDPLNVYRHRLKDFFDFDYQVECFVPEAKRKYGYFSLPILAGDTFIARMDSKADRKKSVLMINNLHFESVDIAGTTLNKLIKAIIKFAEFNRCQAITIKKCNNKKLLRVLQEGLSVLT